MDKQDVLRALELSALAYELQQPHFPRTSLRIIDDCPTGVQCYLRRQNGVLTITFRGSNSATDWHHNLDFWKKCIPYGNCDSKIRVHSGFLSAYKDPHVRERIHRYVTEDIHSIRVMGHSLGAAMAVLCGVDLQYNFPHRDYEVYLFGCPRVGNKAFQTSYNRRVFKTLRVENGNDIVTKIPLWIMGYRHVGIPIRVGAPRLPFVFSLHAHRQQSYFQKVFTTLMP